MLKNFVVCMSVTLLTACAAFQDKPPEEWVEIRANEQAQALIERDYALALTYVVPSFQESARADLYEARYEGSSFWNSAEVRWVKCGDAPDPQRCEVRLWIYGNIPSAGRYASQRGKDVPISLDSVWIKTEGNWYQFLD